MRILVNASIMVSGVVVLELDSLEDGGRVTVLNDKDFVYTTVQALQKEGEALETGAPQYHQDNDLRNVAVLRLIARAHERMRHELENKGHLVVPAEVEKGKAN